MTRRRWFDTQKTPTCVIFVFSRHSIINLTHWSFNLLAPIFDIDIIYIYYRYKCDSSISSVKMIVSYTVHVVSVKNHCTVTWPTHHVQLHRVSFNLWVLNEISGLTCLKCEELLSLAHTMCVLCICHQPKWMWNVQFKKEFEIYTCACLFLHRNCIFFCVNILKDYSRFQQKALKQSDENL